MSDLLTIKRTTAEGVAEAIRRKTGKTALLTSDEWEAEIDSISGSDPLVEFDQQNALVSQYLSASAGYSAEDYSTTVMTLDYMYAEPGYVKWHPTGHTITVKAGGELHLTDGDKTLVKTVTAGEQVLVNCAPGKIAHWWLTVDGTVMQSGTVKPSGKVRMIATAAINVRDLGGWDCDGGTVKYGKLFRGALLTEADAGVLVDQLGIRHDLDLRGTSDNDGITESPLGSEIRYTVTDGYPWYSLTYDGWAEILRKVFDAVAHDEPLIFHCRQGADRTGTVACIVEALLGMDQTDIDRDYELSTLAGTEESPCQRIRTTPTTWVALINEITALTAGDSFRDKVVNWVGSLGFTEDDINAFRRAMIDGDPADITIEVTETFALLEYAAVATEKTGEVNLGYVTTANTGFKLVYNALSGGANGEAQYSGIFGNNDFAFGFQADARAYKGTNKSFALNANAGSGEHTVTVNYNNRGECSIDGTEKSWNSTTTATNFNEALCAFSANTHSAFTRGKAYMTAIYDIEITESGSVVKHYKAARRNDGNVGFIEVDSEGAMILGTFCPSTGAVYDPVTFETMAVMTLEYEEV